VTDLSVPDGAEPEEAGRKKPSRDAELSGRKKLRDKLLDLYDDISKGFDNQNERVNEIMDNWDMMNCRLGGKQFYNGNSKIFVPLVRDAVEAQVTRYVNQLCPESGRYVDACTENGDIPFAEVSLLEHYVRANKLRTEVLPPLVRNGAAEGQWSIYVDWVETTRSVVKRDLQPVTDEDGMEIGGEVETIFEEPIKDGRPRVTVISDSDMIVLPVTADSIPQALEAGGVVAIRRRWSKAMIKKMIADGDIAKAAGEDLLDSMSSADHPGRRNVQKHQATAAGIKTDGGIKHCVVYEAWTRMKVDDEIALIRAYYAGEDVLLGAKRNPYWNDRCPLISAPARKISGLFKGRPQVSDVGDIQIQANDQINLGADTAILSVQPIIMTDPAKNPMIDSMILAPGAIWETSPSDTHFAQFPQLWKDSLEIVANCKAQIQQTLGVSPSMIPQSSGSKGGKRNQAEIAMEQQVDLLTTADVVTAIQESILDEMLLRFAEYDHQFRDKALTVRAYGPMGMRANMEDVEPIRLDRSLSFRWLGVDSARNAAQRQNQIAFLNVLKGIPPQAMGGKKLDLGPVIDHITLGVLGPRLAPLTVVDESKQQSVDPEQENQMLAQGFEVMVHPPDDDAKHLQAHMQALQQTGDPHGTIKSHIIRQQAQMQAKAMAQQQQQQAQAKGLPGAPGGAGPGVAGAPRPGSQPQAPRQLRGPGGMINPDQMAAAGAPGMPRKT
jgi:hypothetical protein